MNSSALVNDTHQRRHLPGTSQGTDDTMGLTLRIGLPTDKSAPYIDRRGHFWSGPKAIAERLVQE